MTWEQLERPASQGGMSMGEGRKKEPTFDSSGRVNGTIYEGCPNSPDGYHHFTAVSNIQSVEHFVCDYCPENWYD